MTADRVTVRIESSRPLFIEADADNFGKVFARMSDADQVAVLSAIVEHMKPHPIQWDYISMALDKDENRDVRTRLASLFPEVVAEPELLEACAAFVAYNDMGEDDHVGLMLAYADMLAKARAAIAKAEGRV